MNKLINVIASLTITLSIASVATFSVSQLTENVANASSISPAKVKKGNSAIKKSLKEDQSFYNGGDGRYEWASYVESIKVFTPAAKKWLSNHYHEIDWERS